ncbi:MAG TPA: GNA1162 family protein [Anaeromyxobacteraceae bacterium]|nr:GNA1162 family protein [Anaeromyxobacteraceae bacterium]
MRPALTRFVALAAVVVLAGCARHRTYHDPNMDFGSVHTVAVLPFWNLSHDQQAADRVRDVFTNALLATNGVYVVPTGEVARALSRVGVAVSSTPSADEVVRLCAMLKADAVITGVLKEYGEIRSSSSTANVVALSLQMQDGATGKVIWSGASSKGGIGWGARLLGAAGGEPMNEVTEHAVDDLLDQLFD